MIRKRSITQRIEMFKQMKELLLEEFKQGNGDPIRIGQLLLLIENIEITDTGEIHPLNDGNELFMSKKEFKQRVSHIKKKV